MASNDSDPAPIIGVTSYDDRARFGVWDVRCAVLPWTYVDTVTRAGGVPVLLPPVPSPAAAGALDRLDGLVLTGGPDIEPVRYGQHPHERTGPPAVGRDAFELSLLDRAGSLGIPVLGVCRGLQLINIACGGTLSQHLPDLPGVDPEHLHSPGVYGTHRVDTVAGSQVAGAIGAGAKVRSHHHQGIDRLGAGLRATAFAPDGTIEAAEAPGLVGVQWHPEEDTGEPVLFAALVADARRYRAGRA